MTSKRRSREEGAFQETTPTNTMAAETPNLNPSTTLPFETIKDILTRLPVKSLTRFEAVSKPFLSLIKSPEFVSAHLARSSRSPALLLRRYHNPTGSNFCISFLDPHSSMPRDVRIPFHSSLIRFPKIIGSSCGLLCLDISPCYAVAFMLWNVASTQFRTLPRPRIVDNQLPFWMVSTGFGYDHVNDDFYLVRIVGFKPDPIVEAELHEVRAEVFSWKNDCWKVFDRTLTEPSLGSCSINEGQLGVSVNGSIHWIANGVGKGLVGRKFVVSYDTGSEEFRRIPIPEFSGDVCVKVMGFKESLALAFYAPLPVYPPGVGAFGRGMMERVELCVLDDYGTDGKCWIKLHSFPSSYGVVPGCPVGIWNDCELIMKRQEGQCVSLSVSDPRIQGAKRFPICPVDFSCEIYRYVESLVPVNVFVGQEQG